MRNIPKIITVDRMLLTNAMVIQSRDKLRKRTLRKAYKMAHGAYPKYVEFANSYNRNHRRYSDKAYKEIIKSLERITAKENFSFEGETSHPLNTPTPSFGLRTLYKLENNEVKDMTVTGVSVY